MLSRIEALEMKDGSISLTARKVQEALRAHGLGCRVLEMPSSTRTAQEAAQAVGCSLGQIAKSLIFRGRDSGEPLLVIASGANRVNETAMAALAGEGIERASPDFVRQTTGYAIGGVPPLGHDRPIRVWMDEELLRYETIWAAAGTPSALFEISPNELQRVTAAKLISVQ